MGTVTIQFKNGNEVKMRENLFIRWRLGKFVVFEKGRGRLYDDFDYFSFSPDIESITFENFNFDKKTWSLIFKNQQTKVLLKNCFYGNTHLVFKCGIIKVENVKSKTKKKKITNLEIRENQSFHFENNSANDLKLILDIEDSLKTTLTGKGCFKTIFVWSPDVKIENFEAVVDNKFSLQYKNPLDSTCVLKNVCLVCKNEVAIHHMNYKVEDVILESDESIRFGESRYKNKTEKVCVTDAEINDPKRKSLAFLLSILKFQKEKIEKQNQKDLEKIGLQIQEKYDKKINELIEEKEKLVAQNKNVIKAANDLIQRRKVKEFKKN